MAIHRQYLKELDFQCNVTVFPNLKKNYLKRGVMVPEKEKNTGFLVIK